jgi:hypothetical protein
MKMFEKLKVGTTHSYVTDDELNYAKEVYARYVGFLKDRYGDNYGSDRESTAISLVEFLLQDAGYVRLDSFMWDKGILVKTRSGCLGLTVGWDKVGISSCNYAVSVRTAGGVGCLYPEDLEKAEIPPEVLEYVKSTLQGKVHDKVDEAFEEG